VTLIGNLWLTTVSLGFDSFLAAFFIGSMIVSWRWGGPGTPPSSVSATGWRRCPALPGAAMPHRLPEPPVAVLYLLCVMLIIMGARRSCAWLFAAPVLLSLDNLAAGGTAAAAQVLALGSAAMAAAGFALGALGRRAVAKFFLRGASI
jgi:hypothetical protein